MEGMLAVTRAIGDRRLKKYVSAMPDVLVRDIGPYDDFLILASDGKAVPMPHSALLTAATPQVCGMCCPTKTPWKYASTPAMRVRLPMTSLKRRTSEAVRTTSHRWW